MIERKKSFNSSLHNVSKKRLAEMRNGTYKPKKPKPIRKVSSKMAKRVKDYREVAFRTWGERCFICGRPAPRTELDVHHPFLRGNGDNVVIPLCKKGCGCGAHNHTGNDKRLLEINKVIYNKLYMMGQAYVFNNESKRLYGVDYPTYYRQQMAKRVKVFGNQNTPKSRFVKRMADAYLDFAITGVAKITEKDLK